MKYTDLKIWQRSHKLVLKIYSITKTFPDDERFGIISQIKRAAVSIPANIAEGYNRNGINDKIKFYNIALSSLNEVDYYIILANDLKFISNDNLRSEIDEIGKMINAFIKKTAERK